LESESIFTVAPGIGSPVSASRTRPAIVPPSFEGVVSTTDRSLPEHPPISKTANPKKKATL
jgi:hypothetical protein